MKNSNVPKTAAHQATFADMEWWEQYFIVFPWIRTILLPALPTIVGFILGAVFASILPLLLGIAGTVVYLATFLERIKPIEKPDGGEAPQFGLLELFGRRLPVVLDEGLALGLPFGRIVRRSKEVINRDVSISGVRCRLKRTEKPNGKFETLWESLQYGIRQSSAADVNSGGSIAFNIGLTIERDWRDGWSIIDYDNTGETEQVVKIITDRIAEDLREIGRRLTWLQASFATDLVSVHLITALTGITEYDGVDNILEDGTNHQIKRFIDDVKINGRSYVGGLGIRIRRLQVKSATPEGDLAKEADRAAVEELRRVGMLENAQAVAEAFAIYRTKVTDGTLTDREVMTAVLVNDPDARVNHEIKTINVPDAGKIADALVRVLEGLGLSKK